MKLPLSWLREFVSVKLQIERLAERLTMSGIEVEKVMHRGRDFEKVVVGQVVDLKPHPNADKLRLAYVVTKSGGQPQEIVCGAPNVAAGQKVAVALLGAQLPNGLTIEARQIRGVASQGMICSERELGLSSNQSGIMVLDPKLEVGTPFATAMGFDDAVLDIAVPANRSDLLSVRGLAWEVAAITASKFKDTPLKLAERGTPSSQLVRVKIEATKLCPIYTARVIRGLNVKPSPAWLQQRLRSAGIRPVNAVVDTTNYVMLEYGQPLHAFDASKVKGKTITVRAARTGERLVTLDGVERKPDASMLVIADAAGPIALAGVMGGAETEISDQTTDVILESAVFDPVSVRKTSRQLGLMSESSLRFEKGLPLQLPAQASATAAALMVKLCGGTVGKGIVRVGQQLAKPTAVKIAPDFVTELLGMDVPAATAKQLLTRLGFRVGGTASPRSSRGWTVTVPFWRRDVSLAEDVVEEVGRMIGYDQLPEGLPQIASVPLPVPSLVRLKDELRDVLVQLGFTEVMTHAFYGQRWATATGGEHYAIANPLDETQHFLRRSLVPHLREVLERAADAGQDALVFEVARVFIPESSKKIPEQQPWKLVIGMAQKVQRQSPAERKLTGVVESLSEALSIRGIKLGTMESQAAKGRIILVGELDVAELRDRRQPKRFSPLPKFPMVERDVSFWLKGHIQYAEIEKAVREAGQTLLERVELFDVFEQENRRSYALRLTFRSPDRTLTDSEISAKMKAINQALRQFGAELR